MSPVAVVANSAAVVVVPVVVVAAAVAVGAAADPAASVVDVAAAAFPELPLGSPTYFYDWMGSCWRGAPAMSKSCISEAAQGRTRGT